VEEDVGLRTTRGVAGAKAAVPKAKKQAVSACRNVFILRVRGGAPSFNKVNRENETGNTLLVLRSESVLVLMQ